MEFKFDANQDFQLDAINAITNVFEGQPYIEAGLSLELGYIPAVSNALDLDDETLLDNLRQVQQQNGLVADEQLLPTEQIIETVEGQVNLKYFNFSIEMETGTGKTYVYLRTALELFQKYGFRKFIIVVPSIAIREGVLKTLQITEKHFRQLYGNLPYRYYEYDSNSLSQVRQFALSDSVELMIMTIDAFNKAGNVIHQSTDRLQGDTPVQLVQATRPILILDEPQTKMEGEKNILALGELLPLMTLRYSATHRNPYNRVYRLTPFDAYRQNLVKRVEVASVVQEDDFNKAFIEVRDIQSSGSSVQAILSVHKLMKSGVKEKTIKVKLGDSLFEKTGLPEYQDYIVERIEYGCVVFNVGSSELEICKGESTGEDKEAIYASQIATAIEEHFRKQRRLNKRDVKVLTLFFIDRVANYRTETGDNGMLRAMFDDAFNQLKQRFSEWQDLEPDQVQAGYFAKKSSGDWDDSTTGTAQKDLEAYDLIMRDKERLLSFDEPVSFIFSHSALNEGWDNPNIFQICALRDVKSYIAKRQQIGRGVRLAVDQNGDRIHDEHLNILTVVASESYTQFVDTYQQEVEQVYGKEGAAPPPVNKRRERIVQRQKKYYLSDDFKILWEKIKHKTRYSVEIDTNSVIQEVVEELERAQIKSPRITSVKAEMTLTDENTFKAVQRTAVTNSGSINGSLFLPDLVRRISYLMAFQSPPISLSRQTILSIIKRSNRLDDGAKNPHEFATVAVKIIKDKLADHLVKGIQYERINQWYEMSLFETEFKSWEDHLIPANKCVYDYVEWDSNIESAFVQAMDEREDIRLYVKLPAWFVVPTPIGNYNPDWAIVMDNPDNRDEEKLYLVRETKGDGELRPTERRKTECGEKHFVNELNVSYRIVTNADDLP